MSTTREIIAALRAADPEGGREVWLAVSNGKPGSDHRTFTDPADAESITVDDEGDVLMEGESS